MDSVGDIWDSMYAIPVAGAFILAGAVYYLSFRVKDDDDQSLRTYLNVLSGDDDRNRKAAKRLRKFGTGSPKKVPTTIGSGSFDNDNEDKQADAVQNKEWQQQHANVQQQKTVDSVHKVSRLDSEKHVDTVSPLNEDQTDGTSSQDPELVIPDSEPSTVKQGSSGWHKAVSRKEKRHVHNNSESNKSNAEDASNHSVTSEESRLSFKNSSSSRGSSPYRHSQQAVSLSQSQQRMTHLAVASSSSTTRKFSSRKSLARPPHLQATAAARPDHLKLEAAGNRQYRQKRTLNHATVPRPAIILSEAVSDEHALAANTESYPVNSEPSFKTSFHNSTLTNEHCSALAPGQSDACIQTEENEDYPSPLEGLRELNAGQPRFVICLDFAMQVDLDVDSSNYDSDIDMRYEDGDKILYSSGGSLSSGDGSTRATPVLEDDSREFSMTADKYTQGGTSHRTNVYYNRTMSGYYYHEYNQHNGDCTQNSRNVSGKQRGGGGGVPYYPTAPNDTLPRTCRAEKGSADWIDNGSRRGRLVNGRWRN
ncbi:hypothetical protein RvY_12974 [Ramazzottius varieornatus]|uniref:Uncharacterized protein n=1 Tax=Ramazzottius varieornatus TaxID=947166 RepID=A0A1D1VQD7_RAMVA|nr:hypothetical protein RvY_12974 [Ramazzottius varieornatus]